jgi:hypothetical protein
VAEFLAELNRDIATVKNRVYGAASLDEAKTYRQLLRLLGWRKEALGKRYDAL